MPSTPSLALERLPARGRCRITLDCGEPLTKPEQHMRKFCLGMVVGTGISAAGVLSYCELSSGA
jgi:hypothetical protein